MNQEMSSRSLGEVIRDYQQLKTRLVEELEILKKYNGEFVLIQNAISEEINDESIDQGLPSIPTEKEVTDSINRVRIYRQGIKEIAQAIQPLKD